MIKNMYSSLLLQAVILIEDGDELAEEICWCDDWREKPENEFGTKNLVPDNSK